jgi:hypothetical protein
MPSDRFSEVEVKVQRWLACGVRLAWVVEPGARRILVYRPRGPRGDIGIEDTISGEDVRPGFTLPVKTALS